MLDGGEIDALYTARTPSTFARRPATVRRLFEDYVAAEHDYHRRTRMYPIMHTVVIRRDIYRAHPWIARSLCKAFAEAKRHAQDDLSATNALSSMLPWQIAHVEEARREIGDDWGPYGSRPIAPCSTPFCATTTNRGCRCAGRPEELFAPETHESFRI
jgi:4,5-dihydroxyphthalate decarboxylase